MHIDLSLVEKLSSLEPKNLIQRCLKLAEEHGELAQEILIEHNASGTQHKAKHANGIANESVDVLLCALSIFFKNGGDVALLQQILNEKCQRWQQYQAVT